MLSTGVCRARKGMPCEIREKFPENGQKRNDKFPVFRSPCKSTKGCTQNPKSVSSRLCPESTRRIIPTRLSCGGE